MEREKRNTHTYKCKDKIYNDAMKRALDEGGMLAVHIEHWVAAYSEGLEVKVKYKPKTSTTKV